MEDRRRNDSNDTVQRVKPPDGGWGWLVVFGCFMIHVIADGLSYSFGLFFVQIVNEFKVTKSAASWIGSMLLAITFGSGPIVSLFVNRYGCRPVAIVGCVISAFAFAISFFANGLVYLYISIGVVGGLGLGLIYLPSIVCVSVYFEKRRALATGLAVCGSGFGTFILAPIYGLLIKHIGWRYSLLVEAATLLSCIGFCYLFKPLQCKGTTGAGGGGDNPNYGSDSYKRTNEIEYQDTIELTPVPPQRGFDNLEEVALKTDTLTTSNGKYRENLFLNSNQSNEDKHQQFENRKEVETSRRSSDFSEASGTRLQPDALGSEEPSNLLCRWLRHLRSWGGFALFLSPVFIFIAVSNFLTNVGYNIPYIYLADFVEEELKFDANDPHLSWLVSAIGISNTFSRVLLGYISDQKWANRLLIYSTSLIFCGCATLMVPLEHNLPWLYFCASTFGATGGVYVSLTSVLLVDLLGLDKLSDAFGIVLFFQGVGTLVGPPIVGALFDVSATYTSGFIFAGITVVVSGAMLYLIPLIRQCEEGRQRAHGRKYADSPQPFTITA